MLKVDNIILLWRVVISNINKRQTECKAKASRNVKKGVIRAQRIKTNNSERENSVVYES